MDLERQQSYNSLSKTESSRTSGTHDETSLKKDSFVPKK